jgi:hypothetical protein
MTEPQPQQPATKPEGRKVGFLLGLGIFFIPYIFSWFTLRKGHTTVSRGIAFAWMGLVIISLASRDNKNPPSSMTGSMAAQQPAQARRAAKQEEAGQPQEEIRWLTQSCSDIATQWGLQSGLTELQKKALWEKAAVAGMHFKWPLKVTSVDSTLGNVTAQFKCQNSKALVSDIILNVNNDDLALKLTKNKTYTVHGTLRDWGNFVGLQGDLVEITE